MELDGNFGTAGERIKACSLIVMFGAIERKNLEKAEARRMEVKMSKNRKSFWEGVLTGVLAVALMVGGVSMGCSAWMCFRCPERRRYPYRARRKT